MTQTFFQEAVNLWWSTKQTNREVVVHGQEGTRSENLSGNTMDGFSFSVKKALIEGGFDENLLYDKRQQNPEAANIPSFFRSSKTMDLIAVEDSMIRGGVDPVLRASIEMKSQKGSVGNNQNNRIEEALGAASDMHLSFNEGLFGSTVERPFFGYVFVIDRSDAVDPVGSNHPHFQCMPDFEGPGGQRHRKFPGPSYEERYQKSFANMVKFGMYDAVCFISTEKPAAGRDAPYWEPEPSLSSTVFMDRLKAHLGL